MAVWPRASTLYGTTMSTGIRRMIYLRVSGIEIETGAVPVGGQAAEVVMVARQAEAEGAVPLAVSPALHCHNSSSCDLHVGSG